MRYNAGVHLWGRGGWGGPLSLVSACVRCGVLCGLWCVVYEVYVLDVLWRVLCVYSHHAYALAVS